MKEFSFEDAKQAVAEEHGFKSWHILIERLVKTASVIELNESITGACELYADSRSRKAANEAVKADISDTDIQMAAMIESTGKDRPIAGVVWKEAIDWYRKKVLEKWEK
jgi:hypothetical protein